MALNIPPKLVDLTVRPLVVGLASTWRIETVHQERFDEARAAGNPRVFMLWHETILPLLWHHRGIQAAIVVSDNRDGQYLADFAKALGYRSVRGSSSKGAARALIGAVRELEAGFAVAFTPDGPRGPRREMKPGFVAAAQRGNGIIIPLWAEADRAWRLNSWDRFLIPKPFARVRVFYGQPFTVGPGREALEAGVTRATASLDALVSEGNGTTKT
ncbi:MAG: lysophospholipid acyltransferase family protein [Gemmatimonadales bacterium]